mmetsp:Transcript_114472/g.214378  ORF Transcript_114472/g.214378 Transcript_114472/m.214378 type:complete len:84 (+) Transcript_114472:549-800(+)
MIALIRIIWMEIVMEQKGHCCIRYGPASGFRKNGAVGSEDESDAPSPSAVQNHFLEGSTAVAFSRAMKNQSTNQDLSLTAVHT